MPSTMPDPVAQPVDLLPDPAEGDAHPLLAAKPLLMVLAQFFPILALGLAYPHVEQQLRGATLDGVGLSVIMISCAVITPILSQAVAAPIYLRLTDLRDDPVHVSRAVLRGAAPAVLVVVPLLVVASVAVGGARGLPAPAFAAFLGLLALYVLMGALMVPAYALRAPVLLVLPWCVFTAALLAAPTALWAPPTAALGLQVATLVALALRPAARRDPVPPPTFAASSVSALRGAAEGLPLWSIPAVIWLLDPDLHSIGFVYIALLPGVVAHQLFFVRVVDPGWQALDAARGSLSSAPYGEARAALGRFGRAIHGGVGQATALLLVLSLVLVCAAVVLHWAWAALLVLVVATAFAAVAAMMRAYTIAMVGSPRMLAVLGVSTVAVVAAGLVLHLSDLVVLSTAGSVYLLVALAGAALSRRAMHRPEYELFWRRAISA